MKITVIGTGYVGLTLGAGLANLGNEVCCLDVIEEKIAKLKSGKIPFFEPELDSLVDQNVKAKRLFFTNHKKEAIEHGQVIFIAVGTPSQKDKDGKFIDDIDLGYIDGAARDIATYASEYKLIVTKSTVPIGTAERIKTVIAEMTPKEGIVGGQKKSFDFDIASNPEFLREGAAIRDFENPDRIIIGVETEKAKALMTQLYQPLQRIGRPIVFTDIKSAEMIKYAANAMLATRISFMNELSRLCEKTGADIKEVARGIGLDDRIGPRFLQAGAGYGGSCFPKDVRGFIATAKQHGLDFSLLKVVDTINEKQKESLLPKIKKLVGDVKEKKIAIWGLSFKPKTDDIREATSLVLIHQLLKEGAQIQVYDPKAMENVRAYFSEQQRTGNGLSLMSDAYACVQDADCVVLVTEWNEFRLIDLSKVSGLVKQKNFVDGRNMYDPEEMKKLGFQYIGVGRGIGRGKII